MALIVEHETVRRRLAAAVAGVFALSLTACEHKLSMNDAAAEMPSPAQFVATAFDSADGYVRAVAANRENAPDLNVDVALLLRVRSTLLSEPRLKVFPLDVGVQSGVITLYGAVDTAENRERAAQIARKVEGVQAVKSDITVNPELLAKQT